MAKNKGLVFLRYVVLFAIVGGIMYGIFYYTTRSTPVVQEPTPPVIIAQPTRKNLSLSITVQGYVEARNTVAVLPLVNGTIEETNLKVGHTVEQGELLAQIEDTPYRQQSLKAQAARIVAQTTFDRIQRLYKNGAVSEQSYEEARAQMEASAAQWELAKFNLDNARIVAPINGTILKSFAGKGNLAHLQQPIALLADLDDLIVRLAIPERYYDRIQDQESELQASLVKQSTTGQTTRVKVIVESVAPYVDPASRTFEVVCRIVQEEPVFIPGMLAKIELIYKDIPSQLLLRQADRTTDGSFYVYDDETSQAIWVVIEPTAENDQYIALPQDYHQTWFIVDGHHTLIDGQKVSVTGERED